MVNHDAQHHTNNAVVRTVGIKRNPSRLQFGSNKGKGKRGNGKTKSAHKKAVATASTDSTESGIGQRKGVTDASRKWKSKDLVANNDDTTAGNLAIYTHYKPQLEQELPATWSVWDIFRNSNPFCAPLPSFAFCPPSNRMIEGDRTLGTQRGEAGAAEWLSPTGHSMATEMASEMGRNHSDSDDDDDSIRDTRQDSSASPSNSVRDSLERMGVYLESSDEDSETGGSESGRFSSGGSDTDGSGPLRRLTGQFNSLMNTSTDSSGSSSVSAKRFLNDISQEESRTISIPLEGVAESPDIDFTFENVHFSGWDGKRSHYTIAVTESDTCALEYAATPGMAKTATTVDAAKLSLLSPECHPLKVNESKRLVAGAGDLKSRELVKSPPIVHFVTRQDSIHGYNDSSFEIEPVKDTPSFQTASWAKGGCMAGFSFFPRDENHNRRVHDKNPGNKLLSSEYDKRLDNPMGNEESKIVLEFLASSSSGGSTLATRTDEAGVFDLDGSLGSRGKCVATPAPKGTNGRPPRSVSRNQSTAKKMQKGSLPASTPFSKTSHYNSAQTKGSRHRRTHGATSATVFFSPQNTFTLQMETERSFVLKALPQSNTTSEKCEEEKLIDIMKENSSKGEKLPSNWRRDARSTPDVARNVPVVVCDRRLENEMSPLMADEYSPAVFCAKDGTNHDGSKVFKGKECTPIQRTSIKQRRKKGKKWHEDRMLKTAVSGGKKKMKLRFARDHESINVNLFGGEAEEAAGEKVEESKDQLRTIESNDVDLLASSFLPKCNPRIQRRSLGGKCVLEGWTGFIPDGSVVGRVKKLGREAVKYIALFSDSPNLYIFDAPGDSQPKRVIDMSKTAVSIPATVVSKKLGHCIQLRNAKSEKVVCTLLPMELRSNCFEDNSHNSLVGAEKFRRSCQSPMSGTKAKSPRKSHWGDPECMTQFAAIEQHSACLHVLYTISAVSIQCRRRKMRKQRQGSAPSKAKTKTKSSASDVVIKIMVS